MAALPRPIVTGPWLGEVGFELLYWIPFLRWFAGRFGVGPDRLVVISRGGTASWYESLSTRYCDVFEDVSTETFRRQHDERIRAVGEQKQRRVSEFDQAVVESAARRRQLTEWSLLHPSVMYELFDPYWWGHVSGDWVHEHASYARLPEPVSDVLAETPRPYVAVKFYFNDCFPATEANRSFARQVLHAVAARGPVVALSTGLNIDDHGGVRVDDLGVRYLPAGLEPAANLAVQSAVVSRARAFVGTYGGFSYLAPFYGVKSVAVFSEPDGFSRKHLDAAQSGFARIGASGLLSIDDVATNPLMADRAWTVTT